MNQLRKAQPRLENHFVCDIVDAAVSATELSNNNYDIYHRTCGYVSSRQSFETRKNIYKIITALTQGVLHYRSSRAGYCSRKRYKRSLSNAAVRTELLTRKTRRA